MSVKLLKESPTYENMKFKIKDFMGTWYEIASIPKDYQEGCVLSKATYKLKDNDNFEVLNECLLGNNKKRKMKTLAKVIDDCKVPKFLVNFPNKNQEEPNYVVWLTDYKNYALVGSPDKSSLWVLSRNKKLEERVYDYLLKFARENGVDVSLLVKSNNRTSGDFMPTDFWNMLWDFLLNNELLFGLGSVLTLFSLLLLLLFFAVAAYLFYHIFTTFDVLQ